MSNNSVVNLENYIKLACVNAAVLDFINKKLYGEVLTIQDASVLDLNSKRAVKSLISQAFTRNTARLLVELNKLSVEQNNLKMEVK